MRRRSRILVFALTVACCVALIRAQSPAAAPMPRLERTPAGVRLLVDDAPYLVLGAQAHNSAASDLASLDPFWKAIDTLGANTAEVPVYWELVEPERGRYDFRLVDAILEQARAHRVRLVVLWFASWKNGEMHYAPAWVKQDPRTYRRVVGPGGDERAILSPFSQAARDADARAFGALMEHLRQVDPAHTVIMVQVENETGLLGADRDYSDEATRAFLSSVPGELTTYLSSHAANLSASLARIVNAPGSRRAGTWREVFGAFAEEAFSAWHIARYVDAVAAAGKQVNPLPMYVNAWLINPGDERAGRWPSGGPTSHVIDIWKAAAPHVDLVAPDVYQPYVEREVTPYARADNPLFVPEIAWTPHAAAFAFPILARFDGIGVSPFGAERSDDKPADAALTEYARSYRVLRSLVPLIASHQHTGDLHAFVQDLDWKQVVSIDSHVALVIEFAAEYDVRRAIGRGLVIRMAPDDLVVAGQGFTAIVRDLAAPIVDPHQWATRQPILSIEEGSFEGSRWIAGRRLNGDERWVRLGADGGILRVRLFLETR